MTLEPSDELLSAVDDLGTTSWSGTTWRHTAPNRNPLSGEGARLMGGRWNPQGLASTLYLATTEATCIAEFERMAAGQANGRTSFLPRTIHTITVTNVDIIDLRTPEQLEAVGLDIADLTSSDRTACQLVGAAAHFLRADGLLAPSATGTGEVLALFESRLALDAIEAVSSYTLAA